MPEITNQRIETKLEISETDQLLGISLDFVATQGVARCRYICNPRRNGQAKCAVAAEIDVESNSVTLSCSGPEGDNGCTSEVVGEWVRTKSPVRLSAEWLVNAANKLESQVKH